MASSQGRAAIQMVVEAIGSGDAKRVNGFMRLIPLEKLPRNILDGLFRTFLTTAVNTNTPAMVQIVVGIWKQRVTGDVGSTDQPTLPSSLAGMLFLQDDVVIRALRMFTQRTLPEGLLEEDTMLEMENLTLIEVFFDIVNYMREDDNATLIACRRAFSAFPDVFSEDTLRGLLRESEHKNGAAADFIGGLIRARSAYAPVPSWVRDFRPDTSTPLPRDSELAATLPDTTVGSFVVPSDEEIIDIGLAGLEDLGLTLEDKEDKRDRLAAYIAASPTSEKVEILRPIIQLHSDELLQTNTAIFRILGPAHPLLGAQPEEMRWGGERMFIGTAYDYDEDDEEIGPDDWFTGACQICDLRIRYYWHALRMPESQGGWEGCYCSWACIRRGYEEAGVPDILQVRLIDFFERAIEETGIQDRRPDTVESVRASNPRIEIYGMPTSLEREIREKEEEATTG